MLKQLMIAGCMATGALGLAAYAADAPATQPSTQAAADAPVNKYCAVQKKDLVDPKITYLYNGKVYGFCCEDCMKDFKKDPQKYAADAK